MTRQLTALLAASPPHTKGKF